MIKTLLLFMIFGFSLAQAQVRTIPPEAQLNMGEPQRKSLKSVLKDFMVIAEENIKYCSKGKAAKLDNFLAVYNYLSLHDGATGEAACNSEVLKCVVTKDFSNKLSAVVESKSFIKMMKKEHDVGLVSARQVRKFYRKLIEERSP